MVKSRSYIATPPGATIHEQLMDRGMSQKEFAARMDLSEKHVSRLINGGVQLTPDVALRLEMVLGIPASFWNNLEAIYREKKAKVAAEKSLDQDIELARKLPYSEMAKYGWVPATRDPKEKVEYLRKYFEVVGLSLLGNQNITKIACRRLAVTEKSDLALMAWAQEAKIKARDIETAAVNIRSLHKNIPEIRSMTRERPSKFGPRLQTLLADQGVALVFLPHLKGSFLQGATFLDSDKIVIGMTARGGDADKFWFSLFHELAHIVLGHAGQKNGTSEHDEKAADRWAEDTLIPSKNFAEFCAASNYSRKSVRSFAEQIDIAPGVVIGRMQKEGVIKYSELNDLKEHYEMAM